MTPIKHDAYRLVTLPRRFLDVVAGPAPEPPYRLIRPPAETVDDVERWLRLRDVSLSRMDLSARLRLSKRLLMARWLVEEGRINEGS